MEDIFLQSFLSSIKQFLGKLPVRGIGNRGREKFLRRLVKRPFDGKEDRLHQMLFAARKDEMHIRGELDIRFQQAFHSFLRIFHYLLEFINGYVTFYSRLV